MDTELHKPTHFSLKFTIFCYLSYGSARFILSSVSKFLTKYSAVRTHWKNLFVKCYFEISFSFNVCQYNYINSVI